MLNGCQLSSWSRTQGTTACSSGEAPFLATAVLSNEFLGIAPILRKFGWKSMLRFGRTPMCRAVLSRLGSGRMKQLETRQLACQQ